MSPKTRKASRDAVPAPPEILFDTATVRDSVAALGHRIEGEIGDEDTLLVALLGFFLYAGRAVLQAWLLDATPAGLGGSAIGLLFGAQAAGAAIGPICAGVLADHFGIMAAFYFLAGTIIIANFLIFLTPAGLMKLD